MNTRNRGLQDQGQIGGWLSGTHTDRQYADNPGTRTVGSGKALQDRDNYKK